MAQRRIEKLSDEELYKDWIEWIERVYNETVGLAWNRRVFRNVGRVFEHNKHLQETGGFLWDWMRSNYIAGAAMSFRREMDRHGATFNLKNLLSEIEKRPGVLTRRRYYDKWGPIDHPVQEHLRAKSFEQFKSTRVSDDPLDDHIDPQAVRQDRLELEQDTKIVQNFVEQTIAHRARYEVETVTMKQFNDAIDAIVPIFSKYFAMLTLSSVAQVEPVPQYNTHEPFTFPWDVTCDRIWQECRKSNALPWGKIREVYEK